MTYDTDERGTQTSRPREGISIGMPGQTYNFATGDQSILIGVTTYQPFPARRGESAISSDGNANVMEITLPVTHPAVQRYMRAGIPPTQAIPVTVWRLQLTSNTAIQVFSGLWTALAVDKHIAKILCSTRGGFALRRRLPMLSIGRECSHVLYDAYCTVSRAGFTVSTTVLTRDGSTISVASMSGKADQWAKHGEVLHVASGERMTIGSQIGTTIQMQCAIGAMQDGDAVQVFAGCAHDVSACRDKFANAVNFGGLPELPNHNPFTVNGFGVIQQT